MLLGIGSLMLSNSSFLKTMERHGMTMLVENGSKQVKSHKMIVMSKENLLLILQCMEMHSE